MHVVAVIAVDGVLPYELGIPCEVFGRTAVPNLTKPYAVEVCGPTRAIRAGAFDLCVPFDLDRVARAHTVMLPGVADPSMRMPEQVLTAVREAAQRGARVASICTGAFILAATGLLDGLRATTHWRAAPALAMRYPEITVDPDALFVDNGHLLTSAGAAAGLDLCLHMVARDHGLAVAAHAARLAVVPLMREGGQSQFIVHEPPTSATRLEPLLQWIDANLHRPLHLEEMARHSAMTIRTLSRQFRQQVGTTPLQWVLAARVRRAQLLLETTDLTVEQVTMQVGFETATTLRERFARVVGTTPTNYRRTMGRKAHTVRAVDGHTPPRRPA